MAIEVLLRRALFAAAFLLIGVQGYLLHELRDHVARGVFAPAFVESAMQLADILTKALRVGSHLDMVGRLLYIPNSMTVKEGEWITVDRCGGG